MNHRSLFLFSGEQQSEAEWPTWKTHRSTNNFPPHNHRYQLPLGTWYMEESTNFCLQTDLHIIPIRSSIPVATTTSSARSYIWPNKPRAHWTMVAEPSPQNQIGEAAIEPRTNYSYRVIVIFGFEELYLGHCDRTRRLTDCALPLIRLAKKGRTFPPHCPP